MDTKYSKFLSLGWRDLAGAIISAIIVALVGYLSTVTNVMEIDLKEVLNIAFLTGIASLLKAIGTSQDGRFMGAIKIK